MFTYRQLKAELERMDESQLDQQVVYSAEERDGGYVRSVWVAPEDYVDGGEGPEPRRFYPDEDLEVVMPAGTTILSETP